VPTRFGDGLDEFPSEFVGELFQFFEIEAFHVVGVIDTVEDGFGRGAGVGWALLGFGEGG
jgi:hypothetical protein